MLRRDPFALCVEISPSRSEPFIEESYFLSQKSPAKSSSKSIEFEPEYNYKE